MNLSIESIREKIACPQFGDDYYGEWGALTLEQRFTILHLINFIKVQDKEIERLNNKVEELMTLYTTERHVKEDYRHKIDMVIKEIEKYAYYIPEDSKNEIIEYLKGDDKE